MMHALFACDLSYSCLCDATLIRSSGGCVCANAFVPASITAAAAQAPVSGSKKPAIDGTLIFLCGGGDKEYQEVAGALDTMGKAHHLIGTVGAGAKMKLVVNMIMGAQLCARPSNCALLMRLTASFLLCSRRTATERSEARAGALSEGVALADKADLDVGTLITVLGQGALASPLIALKGPLMAQGKFDPAFPLKHQQKDMRLALELGCAPRAPCGAALTTGSAV